MSFKNLYTPPVPTIGNDTDPEETYDVNCNIPVPHRLENDRVLLVPFIPSIHAKAYYDSWTPDLEKYLPLSTPTYQSFLDFIEDILRRSPDAVPFAVIDKTSQPADPNTKIPGRLAGLFGYVHISPQNLSLEIGPAITLPEFQRTFVTSNAAGLLVKYALDLPKEDGTGGLGFRRVVWGANPDNVASITSAEKMGFKREGVMRYSWVLPEGRPGKAVDSRRGARNARDSMVLALCWDDWENGAKEHLEQRMNRVV